MPPREVAEAVKPDLRQAELSGISSVEMIFWVALFALCVIGLCVCSYRMGVQRVWLEAEKHEFAERVYQTSAGEVYRWKSPTDLQHIRLFWEEAVKRGFAERVEWPEGLGEFRWKESNDGIK